MSDTPCVDGCGQDAATIERLRERLVKVEALADEWEADRGILSPDSRFTRDVLVRELRAALAPQSHPRSAADAPEAPGQPGRGERGSGGDFGSCCAVHFTGQWPIMHLCTECGNKRCPKATHCGNDCTGSNEPGQRGSRFA